MRNIAIIPARGGSKRIIKKNIKLFYGKPIIGWAIEAAEKSGLFEKIVISTDCKEIAQISRSLGGEVPFTRPDNISDDHSSVIEVIRHAIKFYETKKETFELATLIYPTAPLIKKRDLVQAVSSINKYDFAMSVTSYSYPIQRALEAGDEETGVWSRSQQQHFIDSLRKNYPTGILVFVKDHFTATSYQNPWKVLDGGNRLRAIRDYIDNKFTDTQGIKYEDLEHQDIAKFNTGYSGLAGIDQCRFDLCSSLLVNPLSSLPNNIAIR